MPRDNVSVLFTNIRSVVPKKEDLCSIIDSSSADIVVLTETWLTSKIRNSEIFPCKKHFNIYRQDRRSRAGGGVLIAVADSISSSCINVVSDLEIIWVSVCINYNKYVLGVCYRPPTKSANFVAELHDVVNAVHVRFPNVPVILLGDFNYPNIVWTSDSPFLNPFSTESNDFLNFCTDFSFSQTVVQPTRVTNSTATILDLVLTTSSELISPLTYLPGLSDHSLLLFSLNIPKCKSSKSVKRIFDYAHADFTAINNDMGSFLAEYLCNFSERSVEANWCLFKDKVNSLTNMYIPVRTIRSSTRSPWFNGALRRLSNKKKRLFRSAKLSASSIADVRWAAYRSVAALYKTTVSEAKQHFFGSTLPAMLLNNPRQFWNVVNPCEKPGVRLTNSDGEEIPERECASALNEMFVDSFSSPNVLDYPDLLPSNFCTMDSITIECGGIVKIIDGLKLSSSSGTDNINSKFLKNTKMYSSVILTKLFQQSLNLGTLPEDWKVGKVIPVHKSGDKSSLSNYRPISLTSIPCKLLEHIIYSHLVAFLNSKSFFTPAQHGFRKLFSCESQLLTLTHNLHVALDRSSAVDCVFLDFSKAFDKVSHRLLLHKLTVLNIEPHILAWIESFLTNRSQFVHVNGCNSDHSPVSSGVPQGSVLGPLLFLIYINDLPTHVSSSIGLFADDCVIYREITNDSDIHSLQSDLDSISRWCDSWNMKLNINKCKSMRVSHQMNTCHSYNISGVVLDSVLSYKYLGVHITNNLSWDTHIQYVINNANRMLGYLKRNFSLASTSLKLLLYKSLVRSKLEYAAAIWDPGITLASSLEAIQNRSARFILHNYHRTSSVSAMKFNLCLPDLSLRRKVSRLCLFHKIHYLNTSMRQLLLIQPSYISSRVDHRYKVGIAHCHTSRFFQSFLPKTSLDWNRLPAAVVEIAESSDFRIAVYNYFLHPL